MFKRFARTFSIALAAMLVATGSVANAAGPYPNPLPDFAHPGSPHQPFFSPKGGDLDRPMLVVFAKFTDVAHQNFSATAAAIAGRAFGSFPSVRDYFSSVSFSKLVLSAAPESDSTASGAANDGVVSVGIGMTQAAFDGQPAADQNMQALQAADSAVNFAQFDANNDGKVTNEELIVLFVKTAPTNQCGANFGVSNVSLDGKTMALGKMAIVGEDTNTMTWAHEIGHQAGDMRDLYGFGVGTLDIAGPTCGGTGAGSLREPNSWQKLHWGWIAPTVVTSDGYYSVSRYDTTGASFLLYDPGKNTDNYFLVENRVRQNGTYDQNASDEGLVIWRVDDAKYGSQSDSIRPVEIMRPDGTATPGGTPCGQSTCFYPGSTTDAWDPSDVNTPQRTMSQTWRDGTSSNVAVRAIGDAGSVIRAFFDVRGPGILVDTYDRMKQGPIFVPLGDTANITFP